MSEVGWLIELPATVDGALFPRWLMIDPRSNQLGFTTDAGQALRFARQVDADRMIRSLATGAKDITEFRHTLALSRECVATEHQWMPEVKEMKNARV